MKKDWYVVGIAWIQSIVAPWDASSSTDVAAAYAPFSNPTVRSKPVTDSSWRYEVMVAKQASA